MKSNIRRKERTESFISKPVRNNNKYKASEDETATEKTSAVPKNLVAVNPYSTTQLGDTEIVNTRRGTQIFNSDEDQQQFMDPISEDKRDDEPAISERRPLRQEAVSMDKADEPSFLTSGRPKRNV